MFTPQANRILIKRADEDEISSSVIHVVHLDETKESQFALVLAVGKNIQSVKSGDTIITKKYCGTPVDLEIVPGEAKERCYLIMEDDALAVSR